MKRRCANAWNNWLRSLFTYVNIKILMNLTPGTDTMYIISRSISQGRKAGVYSVLGISTGSFIHTLLAAFGLSIILKQSIVLFTAIKIIGAAYLICLGIKMLFQKSPLTFEPSALQHLELRKIYMQGVITNVTNPKVALFFISFLPQFIITDNPYGPIPFYYFRNFVYCYRYSLVFNRCIFCFIRY
ncbi:hypothetical protein B4110_3833 [Parageobacillus toebii]|uniref:Threonine efflux protein n=2 Tax=Parageobacillus toebii TaxID=153151 RepID=A0A150MHK7_9BACL|nr:hypothetical protein B4110_3833 [Parageobacillus toebii]